MYTRPDLAMVTRSGMTYCSQTSFDSRFSDRNVPPGSDRSVVSFQNSASDSRSGSPAGAGAATGAGATGAAAPAGGAAGAPAGAAWRAQDAGVAATNTTRS